MIFVDLLRSLRSYRLRTLLMAAGLAEALALLIALEVPQASEIPPPQPPQQRRITCRAAGALVEEARAAGQWGDQILIEAQRAVIWADPNRPPSLETPYHLRCDQVELTVYGAMYPGGERLDTSPAAFLARPDPRGRLRIDRVCMGCTDFGPPADPRELMKALHVFGAALGTLGLWLLLALWMMRSPRLAPVLGDAPTEGEEESVAPLEGARLRPLGEGEPMSLDGPVWTVRGGKVIPAEASDLPRLELPSSGAAFRGVSTGPARVIGPARVNGLALPEGSGTSVQPGDVIAFGQSAIFQLESRSSPPMLWRYHWSGPDRYRFIVESGIAGEGIGFVYVAMLLSALASIASQWSDVVDWNVPLILLVPAVVFGVLSPALPILRLMNVELAGPGTVKIGGKEVRLGSLRIAEGLEGAYELDLIAEDGEVLVAEKVPPCPRMDRAQEMALRKSLLAEAKLLEERLLEREPT